MNGSSLMRKRLLAFVAISVGLGSFATMPPVAFAQSEPAVKMSKTGICHPRGGTYYSRTKNYTPYPSMEACIKAGGRPPKG